MQTNSQLSDTFKNPDNLLSITLEPQALIDNPDARFFVLIQDDLGVKNRHMLRLDNLQLQGQTGDLLGYINESDPETAAVLSQLTAFDDRFPLYIELDDYIVPAELEYRAGRPFKLSIDSSHSKPKLKRAPRKQVESYFVLQLETGEQFPCVTRDVSQTGISFYAPEFFMEKDKQITIGAKTVRLLACEKANTRYNDGYLYRGEFV